jgi:hypothetical protein
MREHIRSKVTDVNWEYEEVTGRSYNTLYERSSSWLSADSLRTIFNGILDLCRTGAGQMTLRIVSFSPRGVFAPTPQRCPLCAHTTGITSACPAPIVNRSTVFIHVKDYEQRICELAGRFRSNYHQWLIKLQRVLVIGRVDRARCRKAVAGSIRASAAYAAAVERVQAGHAGDLFLTSAVVTTLEVEPDHLTLVLMAVGEEVVP